MRKTTLKTQPPKPSITKLKGKADILFSLATRYRFAEQIKGVWVDKCVTCTIVKPIKQMQCGHFQSRGFNATRYSEENTAPQCYGCNVKHQGEQYRFSQFIDDFYGAGTAKRLEQEARRSYQFTREELEQVIHDSQEYIKAYSI